MLCPQAAQQLAKRLRERLISGNPAGPQRIASGRRQRFCCQNGPGWRRVDKGHIGVPVIVIWRIIVVSIQHDNLLHVFGMRVDRMNMQIAKTQRQRSLLLRRNHLLTQEHHLMAQHRMIKLLKLVIT